MYKSKDCIILNNNDITNLKRLRWVCGLVRMPYAPYGKFTKSGFSNKFRNIDGK